MDVAYSANDLQSLSRGRFTLGLGSQVRPRGLDSVMDEIVESAFEHSPSLVVIDSSKALHHF
jgi:alkanesulfonate monooxygenase SsuD/methylene tetrahydromethanopterin reductase-like flavin-dependent oxidoreductase (luciferase family)